MEHVRRPKHAIYCVVPGCGNTLKRYNKLKHASCITGIHYDIPNEDCRCLGTCHFHSFPKDACIQVLWKRLVGKPKMIITNGTRICSRHFEEEPLKRNSIPTLHMKPTNKNNPVETFPINVGQKRRLVFMDDQVASSHRVDYHLLYPQEEAPLVARTSYIHPQGCFEKIKELEEKNHFLKEQNRAMQNLLMKVIPRDTSSTRVPNSPSVSIFRVEPDTGI